MRAEAEGSLRNPGADVVALRVVSALLKNITADEDEGRGLGEEGVGVVGGEECNGKKGDEADVDIVVEGEEKKESEGIVEKEGEEERVKDTLDMGASRRERMYARGDVLEALSDCVVVLRRLPVLLAQYKVQYSGLSSSQDSERCVCSLNFDSVLF